MKHKCRLLTAFLILLSSPNFCQYSKNPTGKLFIIGGGDRSPALMKTLLATARLKPTDYIVILPMSSEEPDTSFFYIKQDFEQVCTNTLVNLNFRHEKVNDLAWLDSVQKAKLIFITGGDQGRFMGVVLHTPVYDAIKAAYAKGATIAGTSAGAAIMSRQMITGNEYSGDSLRAGSFKKIKYHFVEIKEGMGLLNTAIVDQHFIARSRYNRLLSVLAEYPTYPCLGIDEATAIIVDGKKVSVTGESQVVKFTLPKEAQKQASKTGLMRLQNIRVDILTAGDSFVLP